MGLVCKGEDVDLEKGKGKVPEGTIRVEVDC